MDCYWDFLRAAGKKGDKTEESTEAEPMDTATNGAASQE